MTVHRDLGVLIRLFLLMLTDPVPDEQLDDIVTQLMNSDSKYIHFPLIHSPLSHSGNPPAARSAIDEMDEMTVDERDLSNSHSPLS